MNKVIILLGPTGVGKTSVSILLAKALDAEIISADSMQVYKHMDIGTAKPSEEERRIVRHHMIDIVEPWEYYSTGEYIKNVRQIIDSLFEKNKIPLIVGGTGLYIMAMTRGIFEGPSADWNLRNELIEREKEEPGFLFNYLRTIDPPAASKIMPADMRRIVRALEVCLKGSKKISEMQQSLTSPLPYEFIKIGITRERKELYRMIEQRVEKMMEEGLVEEVKQVLELIMEYWSIGVLGYKKEKGIENFHHSITPLLHCSKFPSLQAIGYKELILYLAGEISIDDAVRLIKKRTKMYAKRQFTWFKKEESIRWIDVTGILQPYRIFQKVIDLLNPKNAIKK